MVCGKWLSLDEFTQASRGKFGKDTRCRGCMKVYGAGWNATVVTIGEYSARRSSLRAWWSKYRLRFEDVIRLYEEQDKRCIIGGEPLSWEEKAIHHDHQYPDCEHDKKGTPLQCPPEAVWGLACIRHNSLEGERAKDPEFFDAVSIWHAKNNGGRKELANVA